MDRISSRVTVRGLGPRAWGIFRVSLCIWIVGWWFGSTAQAQMSLSGRGKNFVAPVTDAQGRKTVLRGKDFKPGRPGTVEITGMQAETYKGQEKDMIVEAPQCVFEPKSNVAASPGSLAIRTADDRFSIEGQAFRWQLGDSRLTSKLVISNAVHSLIRKRLLDTKVAPGQKPAGQRPPPAAGGTNQNARGDAGHLHQPIYRCNVRPI